MTCQKFAHFILLDLLLDNHVDYEHLFNLRVNHIQLESHLKDLDCLRQSMVQLLLADQFHHHSSTQAPRYKILSHLIQLARVQISLRLAKPRDQCPHTFDLIDLHVSIR